MGKLNNMNLGKKIGGGFGIVLLLLTVLSLVAWRNSDSTLQGFIKYRGLARENNLTGRIQANMIMVRMNTKDFIITASQKDIEGFYKYLEKTSGFLEESKKMIQDTERLEKIFFISKQVNNYKAAFNKMTALRQARDHLVRDVLNVTGPENERNLTQIMSSAKRDRNVEVGYQAGISIRGILLSRLYVMKFLDTNSRANADRVLLEIKKNGEQLDKLGRLLENTEWRTLFEKVKAGDEKYHQAFVRLQDVVFECNTIITGTLDRLGPEIARAVEEEKLSVKMIRKRCFNPTQGR